MEILKLSIFMFESKSSCISIHHLVRIYTILVLTIQAYSLFYTRVECNLLLLQKNSRESDPTGAADLIQDPV